MNWKIVFSKGAKEEKDNITAMRYTSMNSFVVRKDFLEKKTAHLHGKKVLDIGCGTGDLVVGFGKRNDIVGVDFVKEFIEKYPFRAIEGNLHHLPISKEKFDMCLCFGTLQYINRPYQMLNEARRVLKRGGIVFISTLNKSFVLSSVMEQFGKWKGEVRYNASDLATLVSKAGFTIKEIGYVPVLPNHALQKMFHSLCMNKFLSQDIYVIAERV